MVRQGIRVERLRESKIRDFFRLRGGPCGVLAAVQAFLLRFLFFGSNKMDPKKQWNQVQNSISSEEREHVLARAMSDILSRCRPKDTSKFVLATLANIKEILTPHIKQI